MISHAENIQSHQKSYEEKTRPFSSYKPAVSPPRMQYENDIEDSIGRSSQKEWQNKQSSSRAIKMVTCCNSSLELSGLAMLALKRVHRHQWTIISRVPSSRPENRSTRALRFPRLCQVKRSSLLRVENGAIDVGMLEQSGNLGCEKGCGLNSNFELIWIFNLTPYLELSNLQCA